MTARDKSRQGKSPGEGPKDTLEFIQAGMKAMCNALMWILSPTGPKTKAEPKQGTCNMKSCLERGSHAELEEDGTQVLSHPKVFLPGFAP